MTLPASRTGGDDAVRNARSCAQAVRDLNHATAPWNGWPGLSGPQSLHEVLASLGGSARGLEQAVDQLRSYLSREFKAEGRITSGEVGQVQGDSKGAAKRAAVSAAFALREARLAVTDLAAALERAESATGSLTPATEQRRTRQ